MTITALSGGPPSTGRMTSRSATAPSTSPAPSATTSASQYGPPCSMTVYARNVVNISMPPWAKLTILVARQISTSASATAAYTVPAERPARVRLRKLNHQNPR